MKTFSMYLTIRVCCVWSQFDALYADYFGTAQVVQEEIALRTNQRRDTLTGHVEGLLMRESHRDQYSVLNTNLYLLCTEPPSLFHAVFSVCFAFLFAQEGKKCVLYLFTSVMFMCFLNFFGFYVASCYFVRLKCLLVIVLVGKLSFFYYMTLPLTCCGVSGPEVIFYLNKIKEKSMNFKSRA